MARYCGTGSVVEATRCRQNLTRRIDFAARAFATSPSSSARFVAGPLWNEMTIMQFVGIDTGGTFTDFIAIGPGGVVVRKLPSTPDDPGRVIVGAMNELGFERTSLTVVHGSTVATNALLENKGATTAFVTTRGFTDVLQIGRQDRPDIYQLDWVPPPSIVPRHLRFGVDERVGPHGVVVTELSDSEIERVRAAVAAARPDAVAVGFLFSPENGDHEDRMCAALASLGVPVIASKDVLSEIREYERFSTAAVSASVAPVMEGYLGRLSRALEPAPLYVMESGGGVLSADRIRGQAVRTVLSGPAGGALAALAVAEMHSSDVVSFDMGGTSTDVCLLAGGTLPRTRTMTIRDLPIAVPVVDVHTVGAGGGSLAWIDPGGALRAGPNSSGAHPGPICYGRGGVVPTVTDANVLLGRLPADVLLGGEMPLEADSLPQAFADFGRPLDLDPYAVALGVVRVIEAEMARALRRITQERGVDPRGLSLVPFGGAGGLHALSLARELGIERVIVPPQPGILSALGMLLAPMVEISAAAVLERFDPSLLDELERRVADLEAAGLARLGAADRQRTPIVRRELSLRFVGQSHELDVQWTGSFEASAFDEIGARFHAEYRTRYGFSDESRALEVTAVRSRVELPARLRAEELPTLLNDSNAGFCSRDEVAVILSTGDRATVPRIGRGALEIGDVQRGPAIVVEQSSTLWLPEGSELTVAADRSLVIVLEPVDE